VSTDPQTPDVETPLVTHDEFVGAKSLADLEALYRERGEEGEQKDVLLRAQRDWYRLAVARANEVTAAPATFLPDCTTRQGVEYRVYGLCHGMVGGSDQEYKTFVDDALKDLSVVIENGLFFYPAREKAMIPDFAVLNVVASLRLGIYVGLGFPFLALEFLGDVFKVGGADELAGFEFSPRYHAVPLETRRGLEADPPLPSHLQIEYELGEWERNGWLAGWRQPFAIAPRSMFMAGFALGYAESRDLKTVNVVVGDLHTAEILHFLRQEGLDHPLFLSGQEWGRKTTGQRRLGTLGAKIVHLGVAGGMGAVLLMSMLFALMWAVAKIS
jgi:hypothetical protein